MKYLVTVYLLSIYMSLFSQSPVREPGVWKSIALNPGVGRIVDVVFDPEDGDRMYAAPDANGIWYTQDQGRHWECITDNIPEIEARRNNGVIMVDPDNFDKLYHVGKYGHYYITANRGKNWTRVKDKKGDPVFLTDFKRSILARDKTTGELLMVCTTIGRDHGKLSESWGKGLHISHDEGETWTHYPDPSGEEQYLEIAIHPGNPSIIYAPTTHRLFKSTDGGRSFTSVFDFPSPMGGFSSISTIESNPDRVYIITSSKKDNSNNDDIPRTAIYLSEDAGISWDTIQNMDSMTGYSRSVNGGFAGSWLHCFAVNSSNPDEMITATNIMVESGDGGKNWEIIPWNHRAQARMPDGSVSLNMYGKHIADNHVVKFHPGYKSRVYKACDSGLYLRDSVAGIEDWLEITGDMNTMLFYSVKVNEFGDRYITGNTQDVDIQTYQYNAWQWVRGYEGDVVLINPFTNISYFPSCGCGEGSEIKGLFDLGRGNNASITSWGRPQISVNYRNPEEAVILYKAPSRNGRNSLKLAYHIIDGGKSADTLKMPVKGSLNYFNISRTSEERFTAVSDDTVLISSNKGLTWICRPAPVKDITFGAVDPDMPDRIWLGSKSGRVFESLDAGLTWDTISGGLQNGSILKLLYHEGSERSLYALVAEGDGQFMRPEGVYHINNDNNKWERWMEGYKLQGFSDIIIDYPSQKMLASSYGRGIWEADLEGKFERFFVDDIKVTEINNNGKYRTFRLNTPYHLPEYYDFNWMINGVGTGVNSQYFSPSGLKKGDRISCSFSPKYSPDIILESDQFKIKKQKTEYAEPGKNRVLTSNGGTVDLGYFDNFGSNMNFSLDLLLKPESNGVVLANRRMNDHDAKGWILYYEDDSLILKYSARYNTAGGIDRDGRGTPRSTEKLRFKILPGDWNRIAITFNREGSVTAYLNGNKVACAEMDPSDAGIALNSLFNLHLFSDVFDDYQMKGAVDDIRIWQRELTAGEVLNGAAGDPALYYSFNYESKADIKEWMTGIAPCIEGGISLELKE